MCNRVCLSHTRKALEFVSSGCCFQARAPQFDMKSRAIEQTGAGGRSRRVLRLRSRPAERFKAQPQNERCAASGVRLPIQQKQNRGRIFHGAPKAKPDVERNVTNRFGRENAQIKSNHAKASALQKKIGGAQALVNVAAAHPKES